eukprot:CAMPEP_0114490862 /NCGR_PEP_ID=MMETSP0109-20121206/2679_1 /TAXON_ID=29199 /ORGANISM="Chlorarachnion reptans, Strain CCCM449" /LENGTH=523 /DNA_ID=CAMNT_0001667529 /DNA_START=388 /DNA_END=1959 /DNA_ORIENTATION=+
MDGDKRMGDIKIAKAETRLPTRQMIVVFIVEVCEAVQITFTMPFLVDMVESFSKTQDSAQVGQSVGMLGASYFFAQLISSFAWGRLSDVVGRKISLLLGMIGTIVSAIMLGMSTTLSLAIAARLLNGLLNGNIGIIKSFLAEITDGSNRVRGFSLLSLGWGVGAAIGPLLGGLLAHPTESLPSIFGGSHFLERYPFLLPCLAVSIVQVATFLTTTTLMIEPRRTGKSRLDESSLQSKLMGTVPSNSSNATRVQVKPGILGRFQAKPGILGNISRYSLSACLAYGILSLVNSVDQLLIVLLMQRPRDNGGVSLSISEAGFILSTSSLLMFVSNMFLPSLSKRFGKFNLLNSGLVLLAFITFLTPILSEIINDMLHSVSSSVLSAIGSSLLWILVGMRQLITVSMFSIVLVLVSNSASPTNIGSVNGIGQSLASLLRALGPIFAGQLWVVTRNIVGLHDKSSLLMLESEASSSSSLIANQLAFTAPGIMILAFLAFIKSMPRSLEHPWRSDRNLNLQGTFNATAT